MNEEHETTDVRIYKYHTSKVVCAFKDVDAAETARALLTEAGFDEDEIESFSGLAGEHDLDLDGK